MRFKCLCLDHDDTVVDSTASIHFPCFVQYLEQRHPEIAHRYTLEEYLAKKLRAKDFSLTMNEILVLQGYKVVTYGDFINTPEDAISFMKAKNGINLGNRLLLVHNKIKADYESKFPKASITNEDSELF